MDLPMRETYIVGELSGVGDSFFSSIAQCLAQARGGVFSEKMLRQECKKYAQDRDSSIKTIGYYNILEYMQQIEYCANECSSPITGVPEVEGRIISKLFNVNIYVIEMQRSENFPGTQESKSYSCKMVDKSGCRPVELVDYELTEAIYIIKEDFDYKPILKRAPSSNSDNDKHDRAEMKDADDQNREIETYELREGTSGAGGHFYEIKLLMLFFLRLQTEDKFYLAKNMAQVGAFDDVVFKYASTGKDGVPRSKTIFLQAKHGDSLEGSYITLDSLKSAKGAFSLQKYFKSYREIERKFPTGRGPIFEGKFEDCNFIIFTNYTLEKCRPDDEAAPNEWHNRWIDKGADRIAISRGTHSKQLAIEADINQDIIQGLCHSPIQQLAREIYNYTLGAMKCTGIKIQNAIFQEYHIFLANEVFDVNRNKPSDSKFRKTFTKGNRLWNELHRVARNLEDISEETFNNSLQASKVNLFKTFGNYKLALDTTNFNHLVTELANRIRLSDSDLLKIDSPPENIMQLANNVLVRVAAADYASDTVKFCTGVLDGQAKQFMEALHQKLADNREKKGFDLTEIKFQIDGFPRFSLPASDEDVTEDEVKQFLTKLEFVAGQMKENELDDTVKDEIRKSHHGRHEDIDIISQSLKSQVESWWKCDNYFLTKRTKFFENARDSISHFHLNAWGKLNKRGIEGTGVKFNENVKDKLHKVIVGKRLLNIVAGEGTTLLSCVKVCQTLDQYSGEKSYIFVKLNHLQHIQDHALKIFQTDGTKHFMVIESNSIYQKEFKRPEKYFAKLHDKLNEIVRKYKGKMVVLVTEEDDMLGNYFRDDTENFLKQRDNINLNNLTIPTQEELMEKQVVLHGKCIKMRDLVDFKNKNAKSAITSKTIMSLIKSDNLIISNAPQRLSDSDAAYTKLYVKMPLENLVKGLETGFETNLSFVISGIKKPSSGTLHDELKNHLLQIADPALASDLKGIINLIDKRNNEKSIIIIPKTKEADPLKEFKEICSKKCDNIIYWLKITDKHVSLQQVYDPNFYIKRNFDYAEKTVVNLELILQKNPTALFIFNNAADREKIEQVIETLTKKLHVSYQRRFQDNCENRTIIFAKCESDAEKKFGKTKYAKAYTHWLKINENSKTRFIWHRSYGLAFDAKNENIVFESDLLVQKNSTHTFIFDSSTDKRKVTDMVSTSCERIKARFLENCENRSIIFSPTEKDIDITKQSRSVHWFQMLGDGNEQMVWEKSHGSFEQLRDYIDEHGTERKLYNEQQFSKEIKDKVIIIADEPGMGKTTSLTSVSQQMLNDNWVIRINFLDCDVSIETLPLGKLTLEDVYNFCSKVDSTGLRNDSAKQLLLYNLDPKEHHCRPILIMFDGYDEISSDEQTKIIPLLQFIKEHTSAKLWVTTRLHMMDALENGLSAFATKFEPFILREQKEFLDRFWRVRLAPLLEQENIEEKVGIYSSKLLNESADILGQTISRIMGVPLQLKLLAEGLMCDVVSYLNGCDDQHPKFDHLNVLKLYRNFIDTKYEIYEREKTRLGKIDPSIKSILNAGFDRHHEKSAMHLLFPEKGLVNQERIDFKSVGIIQSMGREGKPYFIHRTFAEYFAAKLLVSYLKKKESNPKKYDCTIRFIRKDMLDEKNQVIYEFIERMLIEDCPIHIATLVNKQREVTELSKGETQCNIFDKLGRTALHLAAREGHLNIVKVLLDNGYDAAHSDALGKTPLHYATMNSHGKVVEHLLNYTADTDIGDNVFATPVHVDMEIGSSLFRDEHSRSSLVTFVNRNDIEGKTAFDYANENNDWRIACALISHGANIIFAREDQKHRLISYITEDDRVAYYFEILGLLLINYPFASSYLKGKYSLQASLPEFISAHHVKVYDSILQNMTSCYNSFEILESLTSDIANSNDCSDEDNLKVAKYMIGKYANYSFIQNLGVSAARNGNLETLKYILKYTLKHTAKHAVKCILKQVKRYDIQDYMIGAIEKGQHNIVMYLFENYSKYITTDELNTALSKAAKYNNLKIVKYLLEKGSDVNARYNGKTPMQYAAQNNSTVVMPYLVKKGFRSTIAGELELMEDYVGSCLTFYKDESMRYDVMMNLVRISEVYPNVAGLTDFIKVADLIISQVHKEVNFRNENGTTLLHIAASFKMQSLAKYLIKHGADVNIKNRKGKTPLHQAVQAYCQGVNNKETIMCLLNKGAIYDEKDKNNATAFDYFSQSQSRNDSVFKLLDLIDTLFKSNTENFKLNILENKVSYGTKNCDGFSLLHVYAGIGNVKMVSRFIKYGCPFDSRNNENCTPKDLAHRYGHKDVVEFIQSIENAFSAIIEDNKEFEIVHRMCAQFTDATDEAGKTMLHWAAANGNVGISKLLLNNRAVINKKDNRGWTPLHYSAKNDHIEIIKLLLYHGARFNLKNWDKKSPLQVATGKALNFLEKVNEMYNAIQFESPEIANKFLKSMRTSNSEAFVAAINCTDNYGNELLTYLAAANDLELVLILLQNGALYYKFNYDCKGTCKEIRIVLKFIDQLLEWKSHLIYSHNTIEKCPTKLQLIRNCRDCQGNTILHTAVDYPINYCRLKFLVKNGADVNAVNKNDRTVLDVAIEKANLDLVKFLLKSNVNVDKLKPDYKQKLIGTAADRERHDIVDIFNSLEKV